MATNRTGSGMAQLVLTLRMHEAEGQSDGQLLRRFLAERDEAAFAALVRRHGPMVLSVCRRVLGNAADAEDAFQATFLVLVRKAGALRSRAVLGDWLHGVARRTAWKAKGAAAHRWIKEQAMARPEAQGAAARDDWLPLLDDELGSLPEKYRLPLVLCDLEGRTRQEAAAQLGCPEGTVAGRLARARTMLAKRLTRRGVTLTGGTLTALLPAAGTACVPVPLLLSTTKAAILVAAGNAASEGVISAKVAALTGEVMKAMLLSKLKPFAVALVVCALGGFGWMGYWSIADEPVATAGTEARDKPAAKPEKKDVANQEAEKREPEPKTPEAKKEEPPAPPPRKPQFQTTFKGVVTALRQPFDVAILNAPSMTFQEALGLLYENLLSKGNECRFVVDVEAFKELYQNDPDKSDPYDCPIRFRAISLMGVATTEEVLALALAQVPESQMLIRDGVIRVTTRKRAALTYLLQQNVLAGFENEPLADVMQTLAHKTGVSIALDSRAEDGAKKKISVTFRNDVTLDGALRIAAEMAGLKAVYMPTGVFVTTPDNAKELEKELRELKK